MTRLTEEMVIARSKQSDLATIKKLNCWGSELTDVSILRRMQGVEVLALSVNNISSLQYFEDCKNLQELYLRKNNLSDINELCYLQALPLLKYIWLDENPFCETLGSNYRVSVLRILPNLKKLDNIEVTPEELAESNRMATPTNEPEVAYEDYDQYPRSPSPVNNKHHYVRRSSSPPKEKLTRKTPYSSEECLICDKKLSTKKKLRAISKESKLSKLKPIPQTPQSPPYQPNPKDNRIPYQQYEQRSPVSEHENSVAVCRERAPIPASISTHSMKEYYQSDRPSQPVQYRHSQTDLSEWDEQHSTPQVHYVSRRSAGSTATRENGDWDSRRVDFYNGFPRRPTHRSSNLLSAALCLIKELDFNSLEVVEHAVRCRINELGTD